MWIKKKFKNLTLWSPGSLSIYLETNQKTLELVNSDNDRYSFCNNWHYYTEEISGDINEIPAGIYRYEKINYSYFLVETTLKHYSSILELEVSKYVIDDFNKFLQDKEIYN